MRLVLLMAASLHRLARLDVQMYIDATFSKRGGAFAGGVWGLSLIIHLLFKNAAYDTSKLHEPKGKGGIGSGIPLVVKRIHTGYCEGRFFGCISRRLWLLCGIYEQIVVC